MATLYGYLLVFLGAGFGGALRHGVNQGTLRAFGPDRPVATILVNVLGSFALGVLAGRFAVQGHSTQTLQLFLATGLLGGFTTFSAFSLEAALLWQRGQLVGSALYVAGSVLLSIAGVFAGLSLLRPFHAA